MHKVCPRCNTSHNKPGTYCCRSCANVRNHSEETKNKTSQALKTRYQNLSAEEKQKYKSKTEKMNIARNIQQANKRQQTETHLLKYDSIRRKVQEEQNYCCNNCGNSEWLGKPIILELEHKNGNNKDNSRRGSNPH